MYLSKYLYLECVKTLHCIYSVGYSNRREPRKATANEGIQIASKQM